MNTTINEKNGFTYKELRNVCIEKEFYTMGDNREYNLMFDMAFNGCTIEELAKDIYKHSDESISYNDVIFALLTIYDRKKECTK